MDWKSNVKIGVFSIFCAISQDVLDTLISNFLRGQKEIFNFAAFVCQEDLFFLFTAFLRGIHPCSSLNTAAVVISPR